MRGALGPLGPVIAAREVCSADWLRALVDREPLVLAPAGLTGWFEGAEVVAVDPVTRGEIPGCAEDSLSAVGAVLQDAFDAAEPRLAVALVPYSGDSEYAVFSGGVVRTPDGWRVWGTLDPASLPKPSAESCAVGLPLMADVHTDLDVAGFSAGVEEVREAVLRGEVYVLNLTRRLSGRARYSPAETFGALVAHAPSTMAAAWLRGDRWIASASPERFVRMRDREVWIDPIKGTRPRGADGPADAARVSELAGDGKERSEHVMVVDMERNDLGRVCVPGSIEVDPLYRIETTSYCHQAVSRVSGLVSPDCGIVDVLRATFPCGSITGAPKVSAMRHIERLEATQRGAYTGSLLAAMPGSLDSSVLIRTLEGRGERVSYGTGCGITVDSDALCEWEESVLKSEPVLGPVPPTAIRETCRISSGTVPLWRLHRQRLRAGGCGPELLAAIDDAVRRELAARSPEAEPTATRLTVDVTPEGAITVRVDARPSSLAVEGGPVVARVDVDADMPRHAGLSKPADRAWWDAAHRLAVEVGAHQAVLVDADGLVVDGSTSAVWMVEDGVLVTVPAPPAIASVSRAFVLEMAADARLEVRVEPVSWQRFAQADEAFLTNALGGCVAVHDRGGALSELVASWFAEAWDGRLLT